MDELLLGAAGYGSAIGGSDWVRRRPSFAVRDAGLWARELLLGGRTAAARVSCCCAGELGKEASCG